ncbi:MAG: antitoxin family protein [Myxococcota bacterium]
MTHSLKARYENGVFRPLEQVDLPEGGTFTVTVVPADWDERWRTLLHELRRGARTLPLDEIEGEIGRAAEEVRAERLGRG